MKSEGEKVHGELVVRKSPKRAARASGVFVCIWILSDTECECTYARVEGLPRIDADLAGAHEGVALSLLVLL